MARIPRQFQKIEAGLYFFDGYTIKKEGVTKQDGTIVAQYYAFDRDGVMVAVRESAKKIFEHLTTLSLSKS